MKLLAAIALLIVITGASFSNNKEQTWIRINQLGYTPAGKKVAVWGSKEDRKITTFQLFDSATGKVVYHGKSGKAFGAYGPFTQTYRLDFSGYKKPGTYFLKTGLVQSPFFKIGKDVYK